MNTLLVEDCVDKVFGKDNRFYLMGISIIWIVFFHIYLWYESSGLGTAPFWIAIFKEGQYGVDIFFFLSAYGLSISYEKNSLALFYKNRMMRILPVYICFLITLFLTVQSDCPFDRMVIQCLYQITGLSLFCYPEFFSTGFCFDWFTPAILVTYLCFPLMFYVVKKITSKKLAEIVFLFCIMVVGYWINLNKHFPFSTYAFRIPVILLGIFTYIHVKNNEINRLLVIYLSCVTFAFLLNHKPLLLSMILPCLLVVYSLAKCRLPLFIWVSLAGRHSFEIYLAHIFPVAFLIPMGGTNVLVITFVTIISTIIISCVFTYVALLVKKIL